MIIILSSAKTLKRLPLLEKRAKQYFKEPFFKKEALVLAKILKQKNKKEIAKLLNVSLSLGELNFKRFQSFPNHFQFDESYPAIFLYYGDVFKGFNFKQYTIEHYDYLDKHIRIISGLFGILKPFDLIYPYRLEMATKFSFTINSNYYDSLYSFWQHKVTEFLNQELEKTKNKILINLASNEYSNVVDKKKFLHPMLNIIFQEKRNGVFKTIALNSKRARGKIVNWIVENQIQDIDEIKNFNLDNYKFSKDKSSEFNWYFLKEH